MQGRLISVYIKGLTLYWKLCLVKYTQDVHLFQIEKRT